MPPAHMAAERQTGRTPEAHGPARVVVAWDDAIAQSRALHKAGNGKELPEGLRIGIEKRPSDDSTHDVTRGGGGNARPVDPGVLSSVRPVAAAGGDIVGRAARDDV